MASIDVYLRSMVRFGASGIVLKSGANVALRFPTGDRHATQTTPHAQLQQMVGAAADDGARRKIVGGTAARFAYPFEGQEYQVDVDPSGDAWTVTIEQAKAKPPDAIAVPPLESGSGSDSPLGGVTGASAKPKQPVGLAAAFPAAAPSALAAPSAAAAPTLEPDFSTPDPAASAPAASAPAASVPAASAPAKAPSAPMAAVPSAPSDGAWIDGILRRMMDMGASDLHLCTGCKPYIRESGAMAILEDYDAFTEEALERHLMEIAPEENRAFFKEKNDTDFAYFVEGLSRFRVNLFRDRKGPGAVLRAIPFKIPTAEELGLPEACLEMCKLTKGLVLVTGPTGSGKSTTLAAMLDHLNKSRADHVLTIEDPVEFVHDNHKCLINQREVHTHTESFKVALRAALREDPDVVLVGEMRDLETIAIAVETAETGHLVFGTLHTSTAPSTVDRIIDQFPADQQEQIRTMLASSLKGVIAQVLCRKKGGGRVAAHEILIGTSAVANLIREKKTFQLFSVMQTGRNQGMKTLNDSLIDLVKRGVIEANEAYMKSVNKAEFKNLLDRAGIAVN